MFVLNKSSNKVAFPGGVICEPGCACEVEKASVGPRLLKDGVLVEVDSLDVAQEEATAPEEPQGTGDGGGGDEPLTLDQVAQKLFEEPELIPADAFTGKGAPEVTALEEAFGRDFTAAERDDIWAQVKVLTDGSNDG